MIRFLSLLILLFLTAPAFAQVVVTPVSVTAPAQSLIISTSPGALTGFELDPGASNGLAFVFAGTSAPADGAVTPVKCYVVKAGSTLGVSYAPGQIVMTPGTVIVFGTDSGLSTHCFNLVKQTAAFISGEVQ